MAKYSNALFNLIANIISAASPRNGAYPAKLIERLKNRFGKILGFADSLLGLGGEE